MMVASRLPLSRIVLPACAALMLAACGGGNYEAVEDDAPIGGPQRERAGESDESIFGEGGFSLSAIRSGFGLLEPGQGGGSLPVNKFLWQASLDTLSFLPLISTDPYTGVIATDWGSTAEAPGERFKVTAYIVNPNLAASSLKVAVFREARTEEGLWVPAPVNPETAVKLEDAILVRARQIRVASEEQGQTG